MEFDQEDNLASIVKSVINSEANQSALEHRFRSLREEFLVSVFIPIREARRHLQRWYQQWKLEICGKTNTSDYFGGILRNLTTTDLEWFIENNSVNDHHDNPVQRMVKDRLLEKKDVAALLEASKPASGARDKQFSRGLVVRTLNRITEKVAMVSAATLIGCILLAVNFSVYSIVYYIALASFTLFIGYAIKRSRWKNLDREYKAAKGRADQAAIKYSNLALSNLDAAYKSRMEKIWSEAQGKLRQLHADVEDINASSGFAISPWDDDVWSSWAPVEETSGAIRVGNWSVVQTDLVDALPELTFGFDIPAVIGFPTGRPLVIEAASQQRSQAMGAIQAVLARLVATTRPGALRLTFIDPVGLGQNVAPFLRLADYNEELINGRVWSESEHIEKRLRELTEHVENVIQKYLRHEFRTIEEYNQQAHEIAEPYRVVIVLDFPINFTQTSAKRLFSLVQNGPRSGVYPIILQNALQPLPSGFSGQDWSESIEHIRLTEEQGLLSEGYLRDDFSAGGRSSFSGTNGEIELGKIYSVKVMPRLYEGDDNEVEIFPGKKGKIFATDSLAYLGHELSAGEILQARVKDLHSDEIRLTTENVQQEKDIVGLDGEDFVLELDHPCPPELLSRIIEEVGVAAQENMTVVVPYARVLALAGIDSDRPQGWWKLGGSTNGEEVSSAELVEVPLGPTGARKAQLLTLGKGTAHHALLAGRTGSGKSNLLHVIITTLALKYSPREVELYLVDFKKGVEFKSYANHGLPHARVIAIESEREFGLSVLQGLDAEMQRRGEAFRTVAANDLAEYRTKANVQLARIILIVDEFQEFFSEDDGIARQAGTIFDRLVRQGRSFGIHVLLGSQSLASSYTLARSTLDQMQIRIALPCSEADSRLILADDNPAARLLSRPGEAIYNASSGLVEGNQVFQVALFSDEDREHYLEAIGRQAADERRRPVVFEGHEPAVLEACQPLAQLLTGSDWPPARKSTEVWIGEPVALKPPTSVRFRRQSGANLLVVTREEEAGVGVLTACVLGLAAQHRTDEVKIFIVDLTTADAAWADMAEDLADLLPHTIEVLGRRDLPGLLDELTAEVTQRIDDEQSAKRWSGYLIIQGLHRARDLRSDPARGYSFGEEGAKANPSEQFATLLREGPEVGIHTLVWCDTYVNLDRTLEPRALVEFGYRVAGAMSNDDSMRLLDDAAAARLDRPNRMIKYDEDQVGVLEKFRPYRVPATAWLEHVAEDLRGR